MRIHGLRIAGLLIAFWLIIGGLRALGHPKLVLVGATQQTVPGGEPGAEFLVPQYAVSRTPQVVAGAKLFGGTSVAAWVLSPLVRRWRHPNR